MQQIDFETFFAKAPKMNPARKLITGVICGVRVEDIKEPVMRDSLSRQTNRRADKRQADGRNLAEVT